QSFQMIAELQEYYSSTPLQSGGYFFDTAPNTNPFISFRQRFPLLASRIESTSVFSTTPLRVDETRHTRTRRTALAMSMAILPQYNWYPSDLATTQDSIRSTIESLFNAPVGSMWFFVVVRQNAQGTGMIAHAQPILRTQDGLVVIPTAMPQITLQAFRNSLVPATNVDGVMDHISLNGSRILYSFTTFQMTGIYENPFNITFSQNNCTGEGEDRRGSGREPRSILVNQCLSGRCLLQ
ncbi:DUF1561 family protein, partial [Helicobacter sp. 13S00477-4]|uniref:DUF1561 family protein n=1 Tax=Helicobacter sp. 13S00477-4 TaxID=1905759 RepID=UPI00117A7CBD